MDNVSDNKCESWLFSLSPCELTLLATAISLILSEGTSGCQREVLGTFLLSIGQNIITFDTQEKCLGSK